jgi:hypothetical protein
MSTSDDRVEHPLRAAPRLLLQGTASAPAWAAARGGAGTTTGSQRSRRSVAGLLLGAALLTACGGSSNDGAAAPSGDGATEPKPTAAPTSPPVDTDPDPEPTAAPTSKPIETDPAEPAALDDVLDRDELQAFTQDCVRAANQYAQADIAYPRSLPARMGEASSYEAAISLRQTVPTSPKDLISAADPKESPVQVECLIAARLQAVGGTLTLETSDRATDGGWVYQQFGPDGDLQWAWSVTPTTPRDGTVRLELRPAVKGLEATELARREVAQYSSQVVVESTMLQRASHWTQNDGELLTKVVQFVFALSAVLMVGVRQVREPVIGALGGLWRRSAPQPASPDAHEPSPGRSSAVTAPARWKRTQRG